MRYKMYLDELSHTLSTAFSTPLHEKKARLRECAQRLDDLNPGEHPEEGLQHHGAARHERRDKRCSRGPGRGPGVG